MTNEITIFPDHSLPSQDYQKLYTAVYLQLSKDFQPFAKIDEKPELLTAEWLFSATKRMLEYILSEQPSSFGQIIYRIDVSENKARRLMYQSEGSIDVLAEEVVRREAQKVWLRHTFS